MDTNHIALIAEAGDYTFEIPEGESRIGRGGAMRAFLNDHTRIAKIQAVLRKDERGLLMQNCGMNPCFVNGIEVPMNRTAALHPGDVLLLVDIAFRVAEYGSIPRKGDSPPGR